MRCKGERLGAASGISGGSETVVHGFGESNAHANHDAGFDGGVGAVVFGTQSGGKSGQKLLSFSAKETITCFPA